MPKRPAEPDWMGTSIGVTASLRLITEQMGAGEIPEASRAALILYDTRGRPEIRLLGYPDPNTRQQVGALNEGISALSSAITSLNVHTGN